MSAARTAIAEVAVIVAEEMAVEGNAMSERGNKGAKGSPHAERYSTAALILWRLGFVAQRVAKRLLAE